jgi:serine/threonine protein kinase
MPNWVGQQLGNYRLIRQLGKGGFGQVYLGEQIYLKTHAAIKLVLEDSGDGKQAEAFKAAFLQEARRIAALRHPHILRVLDFGMEASTPYLVMEYAAHGTLLERHPRGTRVSVDQVVSYTTQLAQALHYAHEARLIHRDVKPANVLLDERDTVLLSDFGIATIAHHTSSMHTGAYAGTAAYMAPEQLQGKPVPASDQYALAIMVYEWLCGQLPYQGDPIAVGMQHLTAPLPSLRQHTPELAPSIEAVVHQAMAKDPRQRFATALDFATALERAAQPTSAAQPPSVGALTRETQPPSQGEWVVSQSAPVLLTTPTSPVSPVLNTSAMRSRPSTRPPTPLVPPPVPSSRRFPRQFVVVLLLVVLLILGGLYGVDTDPWPWNIGRVWHAQNSHTSQGLSTGNHKCTLGLAFH